VTEAHWRNRIVGSGSEAPDQLVANPLNWRIHPRSQQDALLGSLDTVGWVQQVLVNQRTGNLVDGHARVEQALSRGESAIPVLYVDLDPEEEALVLATLDPIAAMAGRDDEKLRMLLADITIDNDALAGMLEAMAPAAPKAGFTDPDDVPDLVDDPGIKPGDLFALGDHRLLCGDSLTDAASAIDGRAVAMVWSDPPYGLGGYSGRSGHHRPVEGDAADPSRLREFAGVGAAPEVYVCSEFRTYPHTLAARGEPRSLIVWAKPSFGMGSGYRRQHEFIAYYGSFKGTTESDLWQEGRDATSDYDHPTQKPVALPERAMRNSTASGDVVLDPFMGSGTSLIAAERLERVSVGIEIDPRYVAVAIKRWEQFTGKRAELIDG
jgi:hypothetical protein